MGRRVYNALAEFINGNINKDEFMDVYDLFDDDINTISQLRGNNLGPIQKNTKEFRDDLQKIIDTDQLMNIPPREGTGLKILTPDQMLACLPILLGQIEAGYNSQNLKYEIRQLLYSLYRSKNNNK